MAAGSIVRGETRCARETERLSERGEVPADRGEFDGRRAVGIGRDGRRSMAVQATRKHRGGLGFAQTAAIEEKIVRIARNLAAGSQPRDRHALKRRKAQRVLGAMGKKSVPVPNGDEGHGAVRLLQGRDLAKHLHFARAFPGRITRGPRRGPQDRDLIVASMGSCGRMQARGCKPAPHPRHVCRCSTDSHLPRCSNGHAKATKNAMQISEHQYVKKLLRPPHHPYKIRIFLAANAKKSRPMRPASERDLGNSVRPWASGRLRRRRRP